jgi:hypothetical protein
MTINNVIGNSHDNATGSLVIKNIQGITNPSNLMAKAMSHIPGNATSLKSGISQWWKYNADSISSAAANQLAAQFTSANSAANNPFRVNPLTLVYMVYGVIFGIPAATAAIYFLYRKGVI